tara:strand:- start:11241 stop:11936 length:696 start_codon:yes stop_codon:yes gene_type:complete
MKIDSWDLPKTNNGIPKINVDNNIEVNTDALESTMTTLLNSQSQDGNGSGTKLGIMIDSISSSNNTIKDNTEFVNSRLNNVQTAQTSTLLNTGQNTRLIGTTNKDGSGSVKYAVLDTDGKLMTASSPTITRSTMTFPSPFDTGAVSSSVDVGNNKTFHCHLEGSITDMHSGFVIQGSNDNTNFVKIQLFWPQTTDSQVSIRGSISDGYKYYRFENIGTSVSLTTKIYNAYN